ncbi:MAG: ABC transporter permease [Candidatus Methanofastidiosa archaeon]|nr:ABC transporter permease [Candidatus Methanofastidiosa archaeon]
MSVRNNLILLGMVAGILFSLIYYALPSDVEETYEIAIFDEDSSQFMSILSMTGAGGLEFKVYDSLEGMKEAIEKGDLIAGIHIPDNFDDDVSAGRSPTLSLYFLHGASEDMMDTFEFIIRSGIEFLAVGQEPSITEYEVLGMDMAGRQVPLREQSLPFYIILALVMEMWTISTLIVEENALGTLRAVLVTPASSSDVITAKSIIGVVYSIFVVSVIMLLTQSIRGNFLALFACVMLGAMFAVSLGLFLGSLTKNITGSYVYVSVPLIILIIPAMLVFIPDVSLSIVKFIPTYYLASAIGDVLNSGAAIAAIASDLFIIAVIDLVFFLLGIFSLRRRYS